MRKKLSTLKLYIIILSLTWSVSGIYGVLSSFEIKGLLFYLSMTSWTFLSFIFLFKKYKPFVRISHISADSILLSTKFISNNEILKAFEINSLEKVLFTLKSPEFDYSTSFLRGGIILKTFYDSYLIDRIDMDFINKRKVRYLKKTWLYKAILYLLLLFPAGAPVISYSFEIDNLVYVSIMVIALFFIALRIIPSFYLGIRLEHRKLPLSDSELCEFKKICIIEGFALSDRLAIIPFRKQSYLDGLAVDLFFKKFIVLNPRLFALGSTDYLRFVLFHELSHIKHHDGSGAIVIPAVIILIDSLIPIVNTPLASYLPYYDYILIGAAAAYFIFALIKRRNIENRADKYGMGRIGQSGVASIYRELGIDLIKKA